MGSVDKTRGGRWRARYRDPAGVQRAKTFERKKDAQKFLSKSETDVVTGNWRDPQLEKITYEAWAEEWWTTTVNLRPSTRKRDEIYLNNHILPRFGSTELGELSPLEIRRWIADLVDKGLAPATVRKAYQIFSKSLRDAVESGVLLHSPCRGISLPKIEAKEMPALTARQILNLSEEIDSRYRMLVLLGAYSAMRWGELVALRRDRVDLDAKTVDVVENIVDLNGELLLPPSPPKTRAGRRRVPLPEAVIDELRAYVEDLKLQESELMFQAPAGGPLRKSFGGRFWIPATKRAGVFPFRFHDLRHTAISYWILCGASPKQIAKWAGHTSVSVVLDRYGHLFPEADEKPMAALDAMFRQAQEKKGLEENSPPD